MKKIMFYICLLFMPFFVFAEDTCNQDDIKIESIVLDSTSGNIEETSNPNADNNQVNLGLKMNVIDDSITYKLVITNTSNQDYTFDKNSLSTDYVNYDITYENNSNVVKAGESKVIFLTVNYSNKPSIDKLNNGLLVDNPKVSFNLQKEEAQNVIEEVAKAIVNPDTKDVIGIFLLILVISLVITIILFRRSKRVKYITLLILAILLTSNVVKALCTCTLEINTSIEIDAKEAVFLPGTEVNVKMKKLADTDTTQEISSHSINDTNITAIKYSELEPSDSNKQEKNIVSTVDSEYPIYMWYDNGTIYWWSEDETPSLNEDASYMFSQLIELKTVPGIKRFDSINTKSMNYMFHSNKKLENLKSFTNWNVSNLENTFAMFEHCEKIENLNGLENWNTSKLTQMSRMFQGQPLLTDINALEKWDTSSVQNMWYLFQGDLLLVDIKSLANWNTSNVLRMQAVFTRTAISDLSPLKKWDTSNVINMYGMFADCENITDLEPLSHWNVSKVENMAWMFGIQDASYIDGVRSNIENYDPLSKWNTDSIKDMSYIFINNNNLYTIDFLASWNTSNLKDISNSFRNTSISNLKPLKDWDVSNVIKGSLAFYNCQKIKTLEGLEDWNVTNIKEYNSMFADIPSLIDASAINNWNINKDATFSKMFINTPVHPEFTKVEGSWNNGTFIPST